MRLIHARAWEMGRYENLQRERLRALVRAGVGVVEGDRLLAQEALEAVLAIVAAHARLTEAS